MDEQPTAQGITTEPPDGLLGLWHGFAPALLGPSTAARQTFCRADKQNPDETRRDRSGTGTIMTDRCG